MNQVILSGRLTADPQIKTLGDKGTLMAKYTLAVRRNAKHGGDNVSFIRCTCWGARAAFAQSWMTKGMRVEVSGELVINQWTDKDGNGRSSAEVLVSRQDFGESLNARVARAEREAGLV